MKNVFLRLVKAYAGWELLYWLVVIILIGFTRVVEAVYHGVGYVVEKPFDGLVTLLVFVFAVGAGAVMTWRRSQRRRETAKQAPEARA